MLAPALANYGHHPINQSDEAHARGYYLDPTDPYERQLVGITTAIGSAINKPYLADWRVKLAAEYVADNVHGLAERERAGVDIVHEIKTKAQLAADYAAAKGTIVHRVMELKALGEMADATWDGDTAPHVDAGLQFFADYQPEVIWAEVTVFHLDDGWAGTCDLIARMHGMTWALDYKTGKKLSSEVGLQLAAIRRAQHAVIEPEPGQFFRVPLPKIDKAGAIHLKETGRYAVKEVETEGLYPRFLGAVAMWHFGQTKGIVGATVPKPGEGGYLVEVREVDPVGSGTGAEMYEPPAAEIASIPEGENDVTDQQGPTDVERYATLRAQAVALAETPGFLDEAGKAWPLDVPTFAQTDRYTAEQAEAVAVTLRTAAAEAGCPFPEDDRPPYQAPPPPELPPAPVLVPGDAPIVGKLAAVLGALPEDLVDDIVQRFVRTGKVPSLSSGKATRAQVAEVAWAIHAAKCAALRRIGAANAHAAVARTFGIDSEPVWAAIGVDAATALDGHVTMFGEVVDACEAGWATTADGEVPTLVLTADGRDALLAIGKRQAVSASKRLYPDRAPTKFDDLAADVPLSCAVLVNNNPNRKQTT